MPTQLATAAAALFCAALFSFAAHAATPGLLDPGYGDGGRRTFAPPGTNVISLTAMATTAAGQIYLFDVYGNDNDNPKLLRIVRLRQSGDVDSSYGANGTLTISSAAFSAPSDAAVQADGKLLISNISELTVCRVSGDALDATFAADTEHPGCASVTQADATLVQVAQMLLQPDGKIVLIGTAVFDGNPFTTALIARFSNDGTPDLSFGLGGVFRVPAFFNTSTQFLGGALGPNGAIYTTGLVKDDQQQGADVLVVRLSGTDGVFDTEFGSGGLVRIPFDQTGTNKAVGRVIRVSASGSILVAAFVTTQFVSDNGPVPRPALLKLTSSGDLDNSFATGGKRIFDPCSGYAFGCNLELVDMNVFTSGRIALTGNVHINMPGANPDFFAYGILPNGTRDSAFGGDPFNPGLSVVPFDLIGPNGSDTVAKSVAVGENLLLTGIAIAPDTDNPPNGTKRAFATAQLGSGLTTLFTVTPAAGPGGSLSPNTPTQTVHSHRVEFVVLPNPGYIVDNISGCGGGMDGERLVTAPIVANCQAQITFKLADPRVFSDSFE